MAVDVVGAFQAPATEQSWMNKVVIGGLVNIVPIVNFIAMGYSLKYFEGLLSGTNEHLPEWQGWGDLFMIGLKAFIVTLIYMVGVIIIGALGTILGGILGGILAFLIFLGTMFLLPVAMVRFVSAGFDIAAALAFKDVYEMARSKLDEYLIVYAVIVGCSLLIAAVASIPVVGWIFGSFAFFYLMLVFCNLLTDLFGTVA